MRVPGASTLFTAGGFMRFIVPALLIASILSMSPVESQSQIPPGEPPQRIDPETARTMLAGAPTILYGGVIEFSDRLVGPYGFANITLRVSVEKGIAFCEGAVQTESSDQTVGGRGLMQIFFQDGRLEKYDSIADVAPATEADVKKFSQKRLDKVNPIQPVYSFVFACPDPGKVGETATWNDFYSSYNQPRPKMSAACAAQLKCAISAEGFPQMLCGGWNVPNPATDQINGVSGTTSLTWRLCKGCKPPPRPGYDLNSKDFNFPPPPPCTP